MTEIELRHDHIDNRNYACCKPVGDDEHGPSLLVNRTLVSGHFRGMKPERAKLSLIVENE